MDNNLHHHHNLPPPKINSNYSESTTHFQINWKYSIVLEKKNWDLLGVSKNLSPHVLVISLQRTYTRYNGNSIEGDENAKASVRDHLMTASDKPPKAEVMNVPACGCSACVRQLKNTNMNN